MPRNPNKIDYSGGLPEGFEAFQIIKELRTGHHKKHHFGEVLFMVTVATLSGMNNFSEIEDFCETQTDLASKMDQFAQRNFHSPNLCQHLRSH